MKNFFPPSFFLFFFFSLFSSLRCSRVRKQRHGEKRRRILMMGSSSNTNHREERVRARTKKKNNININVNINKRKTSKENDEEPQRVEFVLKSHSNTNRKVCFHFSFFLSRRFFPFFCLFVVFPRLIVREG